MMSLTCRRHVPRLRLCLLRCAACPVMTASMTAYENISAFRLVVHEYLCTFEDVNSKT